MSEPLRQVFEISMTGSLPNLVYVDRVISVTDPVADEFDTTYFDTADLRLARHSVRLCRVNGGDDAGWCMDIPDSKGQSTPIRQPLGRSTRAVPAALARQVRVMARNETLRRVATLHTIRTERRLLDETGTVLGTVTDDIMRAEPFGTRGPTSVWRQVAATIVDSDPSLLEAVRYRLAAAGLCPSAAPSTLRRVLTERLPQVTATAMGPDTSSGDLLLAYLRQQTGELIREDRRARRDEPDAVHRMRVATRRLRSSLATYRPLFECARTDPIRDELAWLGSVLGAPRDAEVVRDRLGGEVSQLASELVHGPVIARIERETMSQHEVAHAELVRALDGDRYLALLDALDSLIARPPLLDVATRPARIELVQLVRQACRRVDRIAARADKSVEPQQRDQLLHELRAAAKRARYASESVAPAMGRPATRLAEAMEQVQEVLGEYQDRVTARRVLADMAAVARNAGEDTFTLGLLYGLDQWRGAQALGRYPQVRDAAQRKGVRRWLR